MSTGEECRAAVSHSGRTEVRTLPVPADLAGGALVRVEAAAVCGTDWAHYTDEGFWSRGAVILGHENVGEVVALDPTGPLGASAAVGDRVVVEEVLPCGRCAACRDGHAHRCPATDFRTPGALRYGRTPVQVAPGLWGGFAELLYIHPRAGLHRVPDDVSSHVAAFSNPVANGLRWLQQVAGLRHGEHVAVLGPGAHGLGCVLAARAAGAGTVVAAGLAVDTRRLRDAETLGADLTVRADHDDAVERIHEATAGHGVDVVIDLAPGSAASVDLAVRAAAVGGRVLLAGHKGGRAAPVDVDAVLRKELTLAGVRGPNRRAHVGALRVLQRYADRVTRLHTVTLPLTLVDEALRFVGRHGGVGASHVVVDPRWTAQQAVEAPSRTPAQQEAMTR